jgi:hypothetical protein
MFVREYNEGGCSDAFLQKLASKQILTGPALG